MEIPNLNLRLVLAVAQKAVLKMLSERGGAVRMNISENAISKEGRKGLEGMRKLGLITITPLVGTSEHDVRLTDLGTRIVTYILRSIGQP